MKKNACGTIVFACVCLLSCSLFKEESVSITGTVHVRLRVDQSSGADTVKLSIRPVSGSSGTQARVFTPDGHYLNIATEFGNIVQGLNELTVEVEGAGISGYSRITEVEVLPSGTYVSDIFIGAADAEVKWLRFVSTNDLYYPFVSIDPQGFNVALFRNEPYMNTPGNMLIAVAAGDFSALDSFHVRYPDGLKIGAEPAGRSYVSGYIEADENSLIVVRKGYFPWSESGFIVRIMDFNGAAVTASDNLYIADSINDLFINPTLSQISTIPDTLFNISWSYNNASYIQNAYLLILYKTGGVFGGYDIPGTQTYCTAQVPEGDYRILLLAFDRMIDAEYCYDVFTDTTGEYYSADDAHYVFARRNVAASTPRDFDVVLYRYIELFAFN